ncbi:hypothetical protein AB0F93_00040 [Micromonospora tulbaghiae]|uniref:hypothetical protein n=1 Tax=Micromonospora tulbaghiae TaxID=479978 RepID=UPI00331F7A0B
MTRLLFGGTVPDVFMQDDAEGDLVRAGGGLAEFFVDQTSDTRYTDLLALDGATSLSAVRTSVGGGDGWAAGQLPMFYGPDGVFEMWISVEGSPRQLLTAANLGSYLGPLREQLAAHLDANNQVHLTRLAQMRDVDGESLDEAPTGATIVKDASGLWVAGEAVTGGGTGTGGVTVGTDQTITGAKTFNTGEPDKTRVTVQAAGTGQVADLLVFWSGTDTGQNGQRQRTGYANEKGELRAIAAHFNSTAFRVKGQPGQRANIMEVTDTANVPKAWFGPNYTFFAPNIGRSLPWVAKGNLATGAGLFAWTNDLGVPINIRSVRGKVGTAPGGQPIRLDVKVNGSSIYTTDASRPSIAVGQKNTGRNTGFSTTVVPPDGELTVDIVQVGAGSTPGADLGVQVEVW